MIFPHGAATVVCHLSSLTSSCARRRDPIPTRVHDRPVSELSRHHQRVRGSRKKQRWRMNRRRTRPPSMSAGNMFAPAARAAAASAALCGSSARHMPGSTTGVETSGSTRCNMAHPRTAGHRGGGVLSSSAQPQCHDEDTSPAAQDSSYALARSRTERLDS